MFPDPPGQDAATSCDRMNQNYEIRKSFVRMELAKHLPYIKAVFGPKMLDRIERWLPVIAALVGAALCALAQWRGWDAQLAKQVDLGQFMGVTFNVLAFATPLAVALFAITLAPGGGFIQKLFGTKAYELFVSYVIWATVLGAFALIATAPYLIAKSDSTTAIFISHWTFVWWSIAAAAISAVARVLFIFLVWARSYAHGKKRPENSGSLATR